MSEFDFQKLKCVTLKGELADWGKHLLLPYGITLCGMPTVDADKNEFPQLKEKAFGDMIFEYTDEGRLDGGFDITCKRCLELFDLMKKNNDERKRIMNEKLN